MSDLVKGTTTTSSATGQLCTTCIICGDSVPMISLEISQMLSNKNVYKVCDNCKQAVMQMRRLVEDKDRD